MRAEKHCCGADRLMNDTHSDGAQQKQAKKKQENKEDESNEADATSKNRDATK